MKELKIVAGNISIINLVRKIEKFKEFSEQELRSFIDAGRLREYEPNEIIISWACGVTPQTVALSSKIPFMISHCPGHMFVTDKLSEELAVL